MFVGPRSVEEVEYVKKQSEKCLVIKLESDPDKRFGRRSKEDAQELKEFMRRDFVDIRVKGLQKVLNEAEKSVQNNSTVEELNKGLEEAVKGFL